MSEKMKILKEKQELVAKTIRREETEKVPFLLISDDYNAYYCGLKTADVTTYDQSLEINVKVYEDLQFDTTLYPYAAVSDMILPKMKIFGGGCLEVKDGSKQVNPAKVKIIEPEEYPEIIKDPANYFIEKVYPRRFELFNKSPEEQFDGILQSLGEDERYIEFLKDVEKAGVPIMQGGFAYAPIDLLFDLFRDFSGIVRDVRKCPELVRDAGLAILGEYKKFLNAQPLPDDKVIFIPMHLPAYIKPKDFEKVYWPSFIELAEYLSQNGFNVAYYFEKTYGHLFEYLQEMPKKGVVGIFEEDDIRETKKKLGNTMAIAGGIETTILQHGTKQGCIDHVKALIDDLGPGGGYFLAPDTPLMFPVDAQPENLRAVAEYINKQ